MPNAPQITTADLSEESSTVALLRAAIGPVNTNAYLPVFTQFDMLDRAGVSWNWAAGLCTLNWMAYRQLWSAALAYAGAVVGALLLIFGIGRLVFQFSEGVELGLLLAFALVAFAIPGLYGNALLYAATRKKMAAALASAPTVPEACTLLERRAPSRLRLLLLALVNAAVIGAALPGHFEFPQVGAFSPSAVKAAQPKAAAPATPIGNSSTAITPSAPISAIASSSPIVPSSPATPAVAPAVASAPPVDSAAPIAQAAPTVAEKPAAVSAASVPAPSATVAGPTPGAATPATPVAATATAPTPAKVAEPAPVVAASDPKPEVPAKSSTAVKPAEPTKASKPKAKQDKPAAPAKATPESHYYVNVGLFADANNALNAYVKLSDAGLAATQQEFNTSKGKRTRVRVGPFDTEGQAIAAIEKIRALGLEAIILRPEKP